MTAFQWSQSFVTGLGHVDEQHQVLVGFLNQLGAKLAENDVSEAECEALLENLLDYAASHFREEEELMAEARLDPRHVDAHLAAHRGFIDEVLLLQKDLTVDRPALTKRILDYLTHWLAFHILGQDQNMAAQLRAVSRGADPAAAYESCESARPDSTEPLLKALSNLFEQVSERNRELVQLTQALEERVQRRTEALVEANRKLEVLASTDLLTGLPNRRLALSMLDAAWRESSESGQPLTCLMMDADHFKAVNDCHGHEAGDLVLVAFARALRDSLRTDDTVFRLGGDEFLAVCPRTDMVSGRQVAEKVLQAVNALRVPLGEHCWRGSASIGVASRTAVMKDPVELVRMADRAVYEAKDAGRNCVSAPTAS